MSMAFAMETRSQSLARPAANGGDDARRRPCTSSPARPWTSTRRTSTRTGSFVLGVEEEQFYSRYRTMRRRRLRWLTANSLPPRDAAGLGPAERHPGAEHLRGDGGGAFDMTLIICFLPTSDLFFQAPSQIASGSARAREADRRVLRPALHSRKKMRRAASRPVTTPLT